MLRERLDLGPHRAVIPEKLQPPMHDALASAGSVIFAIAPECRHLTGLDPMGEEAIETHADLVARLLVP